MSWKSALAELQASEAVHSRRIAWRIGQRRRRAEEAFHMIRVGDQTGSKSAMGMLRYLSRLADGSGLRRAMIREIRCADYVPEGWGFAADLSIRTIAPPRTIAHGPANDHSAHPASIVRCVASHTKPKPVNAQRMRLNAIVATISLPFVTMATMHPTNIDSIRCAISIPSVAQNM